jgi:hypothetical protein
MKPLSHFVVKSTSLIIAVLSCFDRVIFKGYLPITNGPALESFVDCVLKIRRCDLGPLPRGGPRPSSTMPRRWPKRPAPNTDLFKAIAASTSWSKRSCDRGPSSMSRSASSAISRPARASNSSAARGAFDWSTHADLDAYSTATSWTRNWARFTST